MNKFSPMNAEELTPLRVRAILQQATTLPHYQRGYLFKIGESNDRDATYCNNYARDVLDSQHVAVPTSWAGGFGGLVSNFNYNIQPINPTGSIIDCINNTPIATAYANLAIAAARGQVQEYTPGQAQAQANLGNLVHIVSTGLDADGHEAIVAPDWENAFDAERGVLMAQAGAYNGILYMSDRRTFGIFGKISEIIGSIKFYQYFFV